MNIRERFIEYAKINTTTDRANGAAGIMPSSPGQRKLANLLKKQLEDMGLENITLSDRCILTAVLPSNCGSNAPSVGFFAHLDTSAEQPADTKPQVVQYQGGDVCLNSKLDIWLKLSDYPELSQYRNQEIIFTDGTSLLGADDKAAIAAMMNAVATLKNEPSIKHGDVQLVFLPDEEQGLRGSKALDVSTINADFGYTLDCCGIGEIVYENWNAAYAEVTFKGQSAHPMSAKGKLVNSLLLAHKFISMLPSGEAPEYTEGKEGYYWVKELAGNSAKTVLKLDIREFDQGHYQQRKNLISTLVENCQQLWGKERVDLLLQDRYQNVADHLQGDNSFPIDIAKQAYKMNNIPINPVAMRGGYDGAILSQKGIPCPNLFTGAHNFHSVYEYLPVNSLKAASQVVLDIIQMTHNNYSN